MNPKSVFYKKQAQTVISNLEKRNMIGYYVSDKENALAKSLELIAPNSVVSWGGSMTLYEIGLLNALKERNENTLLDRSTTSSPDEIDKIYHQAKIADYYLMSTNAITLDGELINIDGNGNRVSSLIHGPKKVVIIAGMNKVCSDVTSGIERVHNFASPPNVQRLNIDTPCSKTGKCHKCLDKSCICCETVITRFSRHDNRIHVILVGEELGY